MLSFGTCSRNRGGNTVCAIKNNFGILVCRSIHGVAKTRVRVTSRVRVRVRVRVRLRVRVRVTVRVRVGVMIG